MKTVGKSVGQALLLLIFGVAIGLSVNQVRGKERIDPLRDYFPPRPAPPTQPAGPDTKPTGPDHPTSTTTASAPAPVDGFQVVTFEQVVEIRNDAAALAEGRCVFIDAREKDEDFNAGHIPGAIHCDHYHLDGCIAAAASAAMSAEKVVVYCTGVDCEDAVLMCNDLVDNEVARFRILLYKGGWDEWHQKGMLSETSETK